MSVGGDEELGLTDEWSLEPIIEQLKAKGLAFADGLTEQELDGIEGDHSFRFPPDLRAFLHQAIPLRWIRDYPPKWINGQIQTTYLNWRDDAPRIVSQGRQYLLDCGFSEQELRHAPFMVPIYGHRFMPTEPEMAGNPVFSIVDKDIIHYGHDLADYLSHEFGVDRPTWAAQVARPIRFWDDQL